MTFEADEFSATFASRAQTAMTALNVPAGCLAGGSLFAGLGTSHSDVDVFLEPVHEATHHRVAAVLQEIASPLRLDVEVLDVASINADVAAFLPALEGEPTGRQLYAMQHAIKRVGVLNSGTIVLRRTQPLDEEIVKWRSHEPLRRWRSIQLSNVWVNNTVEDVRGLIADGDVVSAAHRARQLLELALDMWLVARGEAYPDEKLKWLVRRVRRVNESTVLKNHLIEALTRGPMISTQAVIRHVRLAQSLRVSALATLGDRTASMEGNSLMHDGRVAQGYGLAPWTWFGVEDRKLTVTTASRKSFQLTTRAIDTLLCRRSDRAPGVLAELTEADLLIPTPDG